MAQAQQVPGGQTTVVYFGSTKPRIETSVKSAAAAAASRNESELRLRRPIAGSSGRTCSPPGSWFSQDAAKTIDFAAARQWRSRSRLKGADGFLAITPAASDAAMPAAVSTVGVCDENRFATDTVDVEAADNNITPASYTALVADAFANNAGGVFPSNVVFEANLSMPLELTYGTSQANTPGVAVNAQFGTNDGNSANGMSISSGFNSDRPADGGDNGPIGVNSFLRFDDLAFATVVIPEPTSSLAGIVGLGLLAGRRRR